MGGLTLNNNVGFNKTIAADNTKVANKPNIHDIPKKEELRKDSTVISAKDCNEVKNNHAKGHASAEVNLIDDHHEEHSLVETVTHKAHKGHVGYECATVGAKGVIAAGKSVQNLGRSLTIVSGIESGIDSSKGAKLLAKATSTVGSFHGVATAKLGENVSKVGHFFQEAHHATEATQKVVLNTVAKGASKVGATKTAAQLTKLAKAGHAAHGAAEVAHVASTASKVATGVKAVSTGAKAAAVLGKIAPGIGFAAGMVGAGLAINEAAHSKTKAGVAVHSVRAGLNVIAGGASFVPGVGTAVGLAATAADIGLSYAAKKLGWN